MAIGLSVSLPIFNRNQGNIRAAKISVAQKAHKEEYARRQAENELFTSYARLEKAIQLYRSSNYGLEKDFALIIEGVNLNFQKRNISLLEFIDYYETYKTTCLQLYQTQKEVLLSFNSKGSRVSTEVVACFPQEHTKGTKRMHVIRCLFISFDLLLIVEYMATRYGIYLLQGQ